MSDRAEREKINHARDRIHGGGQPFELSYAPTKDDRRRWRLAAERSARGEDERLDDPTSNES